MAENGGPVFEGVGRPEKTKFNLVDRVKQSVQRKVDEVKAEYEARKAFGQEVQGRVMDRYAKVVGSMNESMIKSAYKGIEPAVKLKAAVEGFSAAAVDVSVKSMLKGTRHLMALGTLVLLGDAGMKSGKDRLKSVLGAVGMAAGGVGAEAVRQKVKDIRPMHTVSNKFEDARDFVGLKSVDILNKIIGRKAEMPAPQMAS